MLTLSPLSTVLDEAERSGKLNLSTQDIRRALPQRQCGQLSGYLFIDPTAVFTVVPGNNPFLHLERDDLTPRNGGTEAIFGMTQV